MATATPGKPYPPVSDAHAEMWELVQRAQAGDTDAFGQIYARYAKIVLQFMQSLVKHWHLAEDLTSDTFILAHKNIGSFTYTGRDFSTWLITIARNTALNYFRTRHYQSTVLVGDMLHEDRADTGLVGNPEARAIESHRKSMLYRALLKLTPEQRECITLRYLHEFSIAETAQAMNKAQGAIKALQGRAMEALKRHLATEVHAR